MFALTHATLMDGHRPTGDDGEIFDAHVLACLLASARETVAAGEGTMAVETGLDSATLGAVLDHWFPTVERGGFSLDDADEPTPEMEEEMLRDLLLAHRAGRGEGEFHSNDLAEPAPDLAAVRSANGVKGNATTSSPPSRGRDREGGLGLASAKAHASVTASSHAATGSGFASSYRPASGPAEPPLPVPPPPGERGREGTGLVNHHGGADREAVVSIHGAKETTQSAHLTNAIATSSSPPSRGRDREGGHGLASPPAHASVAASSHGPASHAPHLPTLLATVVARRAMKPDHLWQDLGLFDRSELNRLLARHFPTLHAGNTANMRWKKYFYRKLCEAEGFSLCTAPSCAQCTEFASCFGSEDGESRMARTRLAVDRAAAE